MEEENLYDYYKKQLDTTNSAGAILNRMYISLFGLEYNTTLIPMFTRLVNLYGRERVFRGIIESSEIKDVTHETYIRLLTYIIKRSIDNEGLQSKDIDVTPLINAIKKKRKNLKTRKLFDEDI